MHNAKPTQGFIRTQAERAIKLFDEVRAMTWRLLNPKP